jgi:hypothetical protein
VETYQRGLGGSFPPPAESEVNVLASHTHVYS